MKYPLLALFGSGLTLSLACNSAVQGDTGDDQPKLDADGDAVADHLGKSIDKNMDGIADCWDIDDDGVEECIAVDTNGDGEPDAIGYDTDGDGIVDALDTTGDGNPDVTSSSGGSGAGTGGEGPSTGGSGLGTGGGSPGVGGTSNGTGVGCSGADIFCETFEGVADGAIPTGNGWLADGASCQYQTGSFSKGVATDQPRKTSTKALKFTNKSTADCRMTAGFGAHDEFWMRAYVYWESTVAFGDRETIPVDLIPTGTAADDSTAIRFGSRTKAPCTGALGGSQVTIIGWGGEITGCDGTKPVIQGEWYCLEAHVRQGSGLELNSYINGSAVTYESEGKAEVDTIVAETFSPQVDHIRVGPFSTGEMTGNLWIDDVAVATQRIGCDD